LRKVGIKADAQHRGREPDMRTLVWFRSDLRTDDNTALSAATQLATRGVIALYVISPGDWHRHDTAPVRVDFILRNLRALSEELQRLNIPLLIRSADHWRSVPSTVAEVADQVGAEEVHANREYELDEQRRDQTTADLLTARSRRLVLHHDQVFIPPGELLTSSGGPYTVYTPFKRACYAEIARRGGLRVAKAPKPPQELAVPPDPVPTSVAGFQSPVDPTLWPAGERHALKRLREFLRERGPSYKRDRDFPALNGTSQLSPYLAAGVISPRRCFIAAVEANQGRMDGGNEGLSHWISELVWREFYRHILALFPRVCMGRAFKPATDRIRWSDNSAHFEAWKAGRTGVPIVDAAMRCLSATGWMHNRLRMVVAMYLTKDLFIDWRWGERHFMLNLIDGDLAQNNGGWQWSASTGTDAAPYFRIFNPVMQSEKFDPDGTFIRRWVPELAGVDPPYIHDPYDDRRGLPMLLRSTLDYPRPLVDREHVKDRVLAAFKGLGNAETPTRQA
jgi:deoxyribodipyrimidine photo-lyase